MAATALSGAAIGGSTNDVETKTASGVVPAAADASNGNSFANGGTELLLVRQSGSTQRTLTVKDRDAATYATVTIPATANRAYLVGPFPVDELGETVTVTASHAELLLGVVKLAGDAISVTG